MRDRETCGKSDECKRLRERERRQRHKQRQRWRKRPANRQTDNLISSYRDGERDQQTDR